MAPCKRRACGFFFAPPFSKLRGANVLSVVAAGVATSPGQHSLCACVRIGRRGTSRAAACPPPLFCHFLVLAAADVASPRYIAPFLSLATDAMRRADGKP